MTKPFMNTVERLPVNIVEGRGAKLRDDTGKWYFDLWGDEGVASLGYGPVFNLSLAQFIASNYPHRLPDMYNNPIRTLAAQKLVENLGFDQVFFCNSGAEVNESMIKLARRYWSKVRQEAGRDEIVTLEGNFHGRTGFALSASDSTDSPYHKDGFGPFPDGFGVLSEDEVIKAAEGIAKGEDDHWVTASQNRAPFHPNEESPGIAWSDIAAIIMAPVLGNNVVKTYSKKFWDSLQKLRTRHGFLVCFDEVQVANGRTGYFAAYQHPDIAFKPDIIGIGKGLALGLPAAALLTTDEVGKAFTPGTHFSTFGGTILVCWMIIQLQDYLVTNLERIRALGQKIQAEFANRKWIKSFDGMGVHWGFTPDWEALGNITGMQFCEEARKNGLLLVTHRPKGCIRFTPPLIIQEREIDEIMRALDITASALSPNVHILWQGSTICGSFHGLFPKDWPIGHKWVSIPDSKLATCQACKEGLAQRASDLCQIT